MADDKKNIPETAPSAEAPAPTVENAAVPEQPAPACADRRRAGHAGTRWAGSTL